MSETDPAAAAAGRRAAPRELLARLHDRTRILDGGCRILSQGANCECPRCDLERIEEVFREADAAAPALLAVSRQFCEAHQGPQLAWCLGCEVVRQHEARQAAEADRSRLLQKLEAVRVELREAYEVQGDQSRLLEEAKEYIARLEQHSGPLIDKPRFESRTPDGDGERDSLIGDRPASLKAEPIAKAGPGSGRASTPAKTTDGDVKHVRFWTRAGGDGPATAGSIPADSHQSAEVARSRLLAGLQQLREQWKELAEQTLTGQPGVRSGPAMIFLRCFRELDALLAEVVPRPPRQEVEDKEDAARVAPLTAGADGQDLSQRSQPAAVTAAERTDALCATCGHPLATHDEGPSEDGCRFVFGWGHECTCGWPVAARLPSPEEPAR